jgi:hypothetical protein
MLRAGVGAKLISIKFSSRVTAAPPSFLKLSTNKPAAVAGYLSDIFLS